MADLENELFEFIVVAILIAIVAIAIWIYLGEKQFSLANALKAVEQAIAGLFSQALSDLSLKPGSGSGLIASPQNAGSGSSIYQIWTGTSQGNTGTPPGGY